MSHISNSDQLPVNREELIIAIYKKAFPVVARYISRRGGSFDEAKDVFHDALIVYYEKSATAPLNNDTAYLVGIAKHLWLKKYRQNEQNISLDNIEIDLSEDENNLSVHRLMHFLEMAGKKCMQLLTSFYYDQLPLTDIANKFGYSGMRSATVQKYKCLEKVRETIKEKALTYDDFME
jgi:DNA-directed RNA polymerase specialized sigma24 family protein